MKPMELNVRAAIGVLVASLLVFASFGCEPKIRSSQLPTSQLDFTFVNLTGLTLKSIYVSPHDVGDWQENILGDELLRSHQRVVIRFDQKDKTANWDLKVEERDGRNAEFKNLDLSRISRLTLRFRNGVASVEAE